MATHAAAAKSEGLDDQGTDRAVGQRLAPKTAHPSPLARCALRSQAPKVGAVCPNWARTVLCGGREVTRVPTAISRVRWASNDYGTALSRIDVLRAVRPGEGYSSVPYVRPGGEALLRLSGWPKVEKVLQAIDAVEALDIHPADAAPEYWQHVHNRLSVDEEPRRYTCVRNQAWLRRRGIAP